MTKPEGIGPKQRRLRLFWIVIIALGLITGMVAAIVDSHFGGAGHARLSGTLFSDSSISQRVAVILLVTLALTTMASPFYYRTIDEHDRSAQEHASLVAFNAYMFLFLGWGIAARGGLAPPMNHGLVFLAVMGVFVITWLWRRYR